MATLDPTIAGVLHDMPPLELTKMSPEKARAVTHDLFLAAAAKDLPIGKVEDLTMPGPGGPLVVRAYTPAGAGARPFTAVMFFHGGGWVIGDLEVYDSNCRILANESGARVFAVDYRLAPEHPFPAAVDDCLAATKWVAANAVSLGVDANRIAVAGDSAGGNLAAAVAQLAKTDGPKIGYQILLYPALHPGKETQSMREFGEGYFLDRAAMGWFYGHYVPKDADQNDPRLSPLAAADFHGLPPAYVVTAGFDPLRDEGVMYADRLKAAGVPTTYVNYPSMIHGFCGMTGVLAAATQALTDAARAMRAALA